MLFLGLYLVFMYREPLSFDDAAETYVVRRFPLTGKALFPFRPGIKPATSRAVKARSNHSATGAPYINIYVKVLRILLLYY